MLKKFLLGFLLICLSLRVYADEGMWLPLLVQRLNHTDMQKHGLQLTAEEIYSVNQSSLKDAVVSFGGFCSGEMISDQGLLLTNHHCAYGAIQSQSTTEKDYLSKGFWAMDRQEELPNQNLYARFLIRMEDVTTKVLAELNEQMSEEAREEAVARISKDIAKEVKGNTHYDVVVKEFFAGNEFYLFVYETFTDVRLVGAPPESIGKFGGDADNWVWPRHTGDFALFRVYASPEGKPADYAEENIPLRPKHHLPVSLNGVKEGDFAMVMGYPASTNRYLSSFGLRQAMEQSNPSKIKIRNQRLKCLKEDMGKNEEIRLKYASKYASISNYWKYFSGQNKRLEQLDVLAEKQALEQAFESWAAADEERQKTYGGALRLLEKSYQESYEADLSYIYFIEAALGTEIIRFANTFRGLETALAQKTGGQERVKGLLESLKSSMQKHFQSYHAPTDQKIMATVLEMYYQDVPEKDHPDAFREVIEKHEGDFDKWTAKVFEKSIFAEEQKVMKFLQDPDLQLLLQDPAYCIATSFIDNYYKNVALRMKELNAMRERGNRLFVRGLKEMYPHKKFYPDANATMRLSFGQVLSYEPRDAVTYKYYTSLEGMVEKMDPDMPDLYIPEKLLSLFSRKDYGPYANEDGELVVSFITNNDISGGNSGSPVMDKHGYLIGTAFDGNREALSGDIAFEPELQRCINVDIRYILFIIDKFAGARHLIEEMTLIKAEEQDRITDTKMSRGK